MVKFFKIFYYIGKYNAIQKIIEINKKIDSLILNIKISLIIAEFHIYSEIQSIADQWAWTDSLIFTLLNYSEWQMSRLTLNFI